jgi:hypothetical protein
VVPVGIEITLASARPRREAYDARVKTVSSGWADRLGEAWRLLKEFPAIIVGRRAAITAFDSGPLKASEEEIGCGWRQEGDVVITSAITSYDDVVGGMRRPSTRCRFFEPLDELGVRYLIVGLSAAVLQGADTVTADIDIWLEDLADSRIDTAAKRASGVWIPGHFGMMPPMLRGRRSPRRRTLVKWSRRFRHRV